MSLIPENQPSCPCCGQSVDPLKLFVFSDGNIASYGNEAVHLSNMQTSVARVLARAWPAGASADQIVRAVYAENEPEFALVNVRVYIHELRKRFQKLKINVLYTRDGGYRFLLPHQAQIARVSVQRRKLAA